MYRGFGVDANGECIQPHFSTLRGIWQGVLTRYYPTEVKRIRKVDWQGGLGSFHMSMLGVGNSKDYPPQRIGLYAASRLRSYPLTGGRSRCASRWAPARACGEIANAADVQRLMPFHFSRRYEDTPQRVYADVASVCSRTLVPKQFWDRCDPRQLDGWLWYTRGNGSSATSATRRRCDTMASRRRTAMRQSAKSSLAFRLSST